MLHFISPYSHSRDLGNAYNESVKIIPNSEDWICLIDADCMFLVPDFGHQIQEIIDLYGNTAGLFSCVVNRVGNLKQCYNNTISEDPNILNHRKIALQLSQEK